MPAKRGSPRASVNVTAANAEAVAATILRYLAERPESGDAVEGIRSWWIARQRLVESERDVERALQMLVERDQIVALKGVDGRTHYRARRPGKW